MPERDSEDVACVERKDLYLQLGRRLFGCFHWCWIFVVVRSALQIAQRRMFAFSPGDGSEHRRTRPLRELALQIHTHRMRLDGARRIPRSSFDTPC